MLNFENGDYNIISSEKTKIGRFEIVYDTIEQNGKEHPYSYVKMKKGVGILGFVGDKVILIRQFRYIWNDWMWEIPGGMVDDGEDPEKAAVREMEEETGFHVKSIHSLGTCYPSIGSTTELQYLYYAECDELGNQHLDDLEKINIALVSKEDFQEMISANKFCHGMGLAAWGKFQGDTRKEY